MAGGPVTQSQLTLTSTNPENGTFRKPPWWNRRSRMERTMCVVTVISLTMFITMAVALAIVGYQYQKNVGDRGQRVSGISKSGRQGKFLQDLSDEGDDSSGICLTQQCVRAAAALLDNIDQKADPCQDFYQFACGGWVRRQIIPEDRSSVSVFSILQEELDNQLRGLVERPLTGTEPEFIKKMKYMYDSCMDLSAIEKAGSEPLKETLKKLGGWPVVEGDNWDGKTFDWLDLLISFRRLGYSHDILLDLSVTPDFRNNSHHVIDLDQTALGMPDRSYLLKGLNDTAVAAYYKLMVDSAVLLGAERQTAEEELLKSLNFEIMLANISKAREERRNISELYNKMAVGDLHKLAPQIAWHKFFNNLLVHEIPDSEPVLVNVPDFIKKLGHIIESADRRILANYMMWRLVLQSIGVLNKPWRELAQDFNNVLTGRTREEPRWEQCMGSLTGSLGVALASLYVRNHFREDSKESAMEMVRYIHDEFLKILDEIDWMDEETRQRARDKAKTIKPYIGFPNELMDDKKVGELYANLTVTKGGYFGNVQNLRKWSTDFAFSQLRLPNLKGDWRKHARAAVVNAYYNALENSIEFPAGILQGTFFNKDRPSYLNYGSIGFVIGHEITHGFDDRGRQFDKEGNNVNWWDHHTDLRFRERAQCIIDQYGNYTVAENGLNVNGINTQGENIADNGGLKEAYRAYMKWVQVNGFEKRLPGLNYTPKQLFWISAANVWCGKYRPEVLKLRVLSGSHSPAQFRVIGPLSNNPTFADEFKCPLGSPMNPVKKCSVW